MSKKNKSGVGMILNGISGSCSINGKPFQFGGSDNVQIDGDGVYTVNGEVVDVGSEGITGGVAVNIQIDGDVETLKTTSGDVIVKGDVHSITTTSGDVDALGVTGDVITSSGDVDCGDIQGNVQTNSGDVDCGAIEGDVVTSSGDVK